MTSRGAGHAPPHLDRPAQLARRRDARAKQRKIKAALDVGFEDILRQLVAAAAAERPAAQGSREAGGGQRAAAQFEPALEMLERLGKRPDPDERLVDSEGALGHRRRPRTAEGQRPISTAFGVLDLAPVLPEDGEIHRALGLQVPSPREAPAPANRQVVLLAGQPEILHHEPGVAPGDPHG